MRKCATSAVLFQSIALERIFYGLKLIFPNFSFMTVIGIQVGTAIAIEYIVTLRQS